MFRPMNIRDNDMDNDVHICMYIDKYAIQPCFVKLKHFILKNFLKVEVTSLPLIL